MPHNCPVPAHTTGKIIFLNGASSAGKSTLAAGLQAALAAPFWHFSVDHLIAASILPQARIDRGDFEWRNLRPQFFDGFQRSLPALAAAGNNLIVEHIVETQEWMGRLVSLLEDFDVFFVGVHCPLSELERREIERADRRPGEARADFETIHTFARYDFEVSSPALVADNVREVISAWEARGRPSAFDRMRATLPAS